MESMGRDSGLTRVPSDLWPAKVVACIAAMNVVQGKATDFILKKDGAVVLPSYHWEKISLMSSCLSLPLFPRCLTKQSIGRN